MIKSNNNKQATRKDLTDLEENLRGDFVKEITRLDKRFDDLEDGIVKWKDEILTSNDKLSKKLDNYLTEQVAIDLNYKRLDKKVENVEGYIEKADKKLELGFERA